MSYFIVWRVLSCHGMLCCVALVVLCYAASIRQGNSLRKAEPLAPKEVSARDGMLSMIKMGGTTLKKADLSAPRGKLAPKPDQVRA